MERNRLAFNPWTALRSQRGFLMVEAMASLSVLGILTLISISVMAMVFNTISQATAMTAQQNRIGLVSDYLESNLHSVQVGEVGLLNDGGNQVNNVSVAGDQFVACHQQHCLRIFYVARDRQIRAAVSDNGPESILPTRGPNQTVAGGGYQLSDPEDPLYDPVLDEGDSFVLADNIVLTDSGSVDTTLTPLFRFADDENTPLVGISNQADSSSNFFDPAFLDTISSVTIHGFVAGQQGVGQNVSPRLLQQQYVLNQ